MANEKPREPGKAVTPQIKVNLEWIEREWRRWVDSPTGQKIIPCGFRVKEHPEHVAKLFAAFCLDRLREESEAS